MKPGDINSLVDIVRELNPWVLIAVSILLIPLPVLPWSIYLNSVEILNDHDQLKLYLHLAFAVLFVVVIFGIRRTDTKTQKMERARKRIYAMLQGRQPSPWASYDAVRDLVNSTYTDDFQKDVIAEYPEIFHSTTIKKTRKPAIAIRKEEPADTKPDEGQ